MALGLYISVPFCRTKCTYCNFASDVFSKALFDGYIGRVRSDIEKSCETAERMDGQFERTVDSIYLGGGTPTILDIAQLRQLFVTIWQNFEVMAAAEITVECAPGTLSDEILETLRLCGVNRVSLGVQSFVDREAASVGRLHSQQIALNEIARLREAGIANINVDLIAGLPHQTADSWQFSLEQTVSAGVPHVSVYMLEVDEDSRLGRELIAGGTKYHAHFVPDEDLTADLYAMACERLELAEIRQYEISNFATGGRESRHNLKYWTRQPYLGFGVAAHSMLFYQDPAFEAVRFSTADSLEAYLSGTALTRTKVDRKAALEESLFLGLRLNCGVDLGDLSLRFGEQAIGSVSAVVDDLRQAGLLERSGTKIRLTARGRLLSNEVFEHFLSLPVI